MLRKGGLDDDHIVVMMADDLAQNYMNPHPGKVFNRPGGENVYEGVPLVSPGTCSKMTRTSLALYAHPLRHTRVS